MRVYTNRHGVPSRLGGKENPEYKKALWQEYKGTDTNYYRAKRMRIWRYAGVSIDTYGQFLTLLYMADFRCEVCGKVLTVSTASLDHDHETGRVRGVLCTRCNLGMGNLDDSIVLLQQGIKYLAGRELCGSM